MPRKRSIYALDKWKLQYVCRGGYAESLRGALLRGRATSLHDQLFTHPPPKYLLSKEGATTVKLQHLVLRVQGIILQFLQHSFVTTS